MKPGDTTAQEVCEFIWECEEAGGLNDLLPHGVPLWRAMRVALSQRLLERLGKGQPPHAWRQSGPIVAKMAQAIRHFTIENPFFFRERAENLIVEHPRTVERDGRRIDLHSSDLETEWDRSGVSWLALSDPSPFGASKPRIARRCSTSAVYELARVEARLLGIQLPSSYAREMRRLDERARQRWAISWGAEKFATHRIRSLYGRQRGYRRLLERLAPKRVFIVVAYGSHTALAQAALMQSIPVIEIQHGAFSRYHLGYSYPGRSSPVPGCPHEFRAWSPAWAQKLKEIHPAVNAVVREPTWLSQRRARARQATKRKVLLVLSQGILGDTIAAKLILSLPKFAGYQIRYKLHPGEYGHAGSYASLNRLVRDHDACVLTDCDLEAEMVEAEVVVGVYSTALYEALDLGCSVYLLDLPGVEAMQDLLDSGQAEMV